MTIETTLIILTIVKLPLALIKAPQIFLGMIAALISLSNPTSSLAQTTLMVSAENSVITEGDVIQFQIALTQQYEMDVRIQWEIAQYGNPAWRPIADIESYSGSRFTTISAGDTVPDAAGLAALRFRTLADMAVEEDFQIVLSIQGARLVDGDTNPVLPGSCEGGTFETRNQLIPQHIGCTSAVRVTDVGGEDEIIDQTSSLNFASLSSAATSVEAGNKAEFRVTLSQPAPSGGLKVDLGGYELHGDFSDNHDTLGVEAFSVTEHVISFFEGETNKILSIPTINRPDRISGNCKVDDIAYEVV